MEGRRDHQKSSRRQQSSSMSKASHIHRPPTHKPHPRAARYDLSTQTLQLRALGEVHKTRLCKKDAILRGDDAPSARRRSSHWRPQAARILSGCMFIRKVTRRSAWCVVALWMEVVREAMEVIRACRRELREELRLETGGGSTAKWVVTRGRLSSDLCQPVGEMVGSLAGSRRRGERQSAGLWKVRRE